MKNLSFFTWGFLILMLPACKTNNPDPSNPSDQDHYLPGTPTEIGKPIGAAVTKVIGPEGGVLISADGKLTLTIPSGALGQSTSLTIEPIENTCLLGVGNSYCIKPENTEFAKDAAFDYQHAEQELNGADDSQFALAMQQPDRSWSIVRKGKFEKPARKFSSKIKRAGRLTAVTRYQLESVHTTLIPSEEATLKLRTTLYWPGNEEDWDIFVMPIVDNTRLSDIGEYRVNGILFGDNNTGNIEFKGFGEDNPVFYYVAPARLPVKDKREVTVSVKLAKDPKVTVSHKFKINSGCTLTIDGKKYEDLNVLLFYTKTDQGMNYQVEIHGIPEKAKITDFNVGLLGGFSGPGLYTLKGGIEELEKQTFFIGGPASDGNGTYNTLYIDFAASEHGEFVFDPSTLNVQEFTGSGAISSGTVSCNLHLDRHKENPVKLQATFRAKAIEF